MRLLVQGWRGINHSYAMVNQNQLLALAGRAGLDMFHQDMPFYRPHWNPAANAAGFAPEAAARIAAIPPLPTGTPADIAYRITFPFRAHGGPEERIFCFATSQFRSVDNSSFFQMPLAPVIDPRVRFITPSHWSKAGLANSGIAADRIAVVPHGVDAAVFRPATADARLATRRTLGIAPDRFVFLNVSAMVGTKGIDLLLAAFAQVRRRHPHALLLLKDMRNLYFNVTADGAIAAALQAAPELARDLPTGAIQIMPANLDLAALAGLYGACDAYVSPYRGEGFNLPPLEAAACGLPIAVTAGGATDDYAHESFALKIASRPMAGDGVQFLQVEMDSLIESMLCLIEGRTPAIDAGVALPWIAEHFSWARVADRLLAALGA